MKHCCNEAADSNNKTSNSSESNEGKVKEARTCHSSRKPTAAIMGEMTMMVEATIAKAVGMAISRQGTEERGRWETHNNQLKLNKDNATYNDDEHNDNAIYNNNVAGGITIGQTTALLGQQPQQNIGKDASPITPVQQL